MNSYFLQEEEERKAHEEKERREHEEYLKLKEAFSVDAEGQDEAEADLNVSWQLCKLLVIPSLLTP